MKTFIKLVCDDLVDVLELDNEVYGDFPVYRAAGETVHAWSNMNGTWTDEFNNLWVEVARAYADHAPAADDARLWYPVELVRARNVLCKSIGELMTHMTGAHVTVASPGLSHLLITIACANNAAGVHERVADLIELVNLDGPDQWVATGQLHIHDHGETTTVLTYVNQRTAQ